MNKRPTSEDRDSLVIPVRGGGDSVVIRVRRPSAEPADADDANWLSAEIEIAVSAFTGKYPANLRREDFVRFKELLAAMPETVSGKAVFATMEGQLRLEIEMTRRGTATVSGEAVAQDAPRVALGFSFESDQSYLQETLAAVRSAVQSFPVKASTSP
jgi:hypothetical protein